jgi:glycosyltransferase involved in cell wall biosynthesis
MQQGLYLLQQVFCGLIGGLWPDAQRRRYTLPMQAVSVISTVLNESEEIARFVTSLLAQSPAAAEIVIVDGGSTDGTWEWLEEASRTHPVLRAIRDESCSLKQCPGPIARGRNVAIRATRSAILACADAGCTYRPDWLANLTAPIQEGKSEYALGGSCLDMSDPTVWDIASAPFFGVKFSSEALSKSCTARSMAFGRELFERIGGFPESVLFGEDTLFDLKARALTRPAFVAPAKAFYHPQYTLTAACSQLARYSISDGILAVRFSRLFRNAFRCLLLLGALAALPWSIWPLLVVVAMQCWLAFKPDAPFLFRHGLRVVAARFFFSVLVPWIITISHLCGLISKANPGNRQNSR